MEPAEIAKIKSSQKFKLKAANADGTPTTNLTMLNKNKGNNFNRNDMIYRKKRLK